MAAAADWANSLEITSGSFQVTEVAPAMRKAFEEEVCMCVIIVCVWVCVCRGVWFSLSSFCPLFRAYVSVTVILGAFVWAGIEGKGARHTGTWAPHIYHDVHDLP